MLSKSDPIYVEGKELVTAMLIMFLKLCVVEIYAHLELIATMMLLFSFYTVCRKGIEIFPQYKVDYSALHV